MKGTIKFLLLLCILFGAQAALAAPILPGSFSTTWQTDNAGLTGNNQIRFALGDGGDGAFCSGVLYWEEVGNDTNNGSSTLDSLCNYEIITFPSPGTYRVDVLGTHPSFRLNYSLSGLSDAEKLLTVEQWGDNVWATFAHSFRSATNMVMNATDVPDLSGLTSLTGMFGAANSFNGNINNWDVSNVTNMSGMFSGANAFNQPLNSWDVSSVTNMRSTFAFTDSFNQDISSWDVSSVTDMYEMFRATTAFNQPLNSWNVSSVTIMTRMFWDATAFNQPLNSWNVSNVTIMGGEAPYNNTGMFSGATAFNQPLNNWDVSSVASLRNMFSDAVAFNQDISAWNVTGTTDFREMFFGAAAFNQNLGAWVIDDGDLLTNIFRDSGLSTTTYATVLIDWAATVPVASSIDLGIVSTAYCATAETARTTLTDTYLWTITDLGSDPCASEEVATSTVPSTNGGSGTIIGLRQKRLDDLKESMSSSTASVSEKLTTFVTSLKKFLNYLTTHEEEVKNLSPEDSKAVILVLRDAILELLRWLPGV
jgi:surface protein